MMETGSAEMKGSMSDWEYVIVPVSSLWRMMM